MYLLWGQLHEYLVSVAFCQEEELKQEKEACQRKIVNHLKGRLPDEDFEEFNPDSNELYCKVSCF